VVVSTSPWSGDSPGGRTSGRTTHRFTEVVTVLLLAVASVGSAWSAFQVSQWNGVETDAARASAGYRIEASREYSLATQIVAYDASAVGQYAQAIAAENVELQTFLSETIVRPGFRPIIDQWKQQIDAGELPTNLLENQEYLDELFAASDATDAKALAASIRSEEAGDTADDYIRLTLFFATALFFAGITASFRTRFPRILLLTLAGATLVVAGSLLASYPIA
jgi:ABC-type Fe3+-siderophore transport system permease subunit